MMKKRVRRFDAGGMASSGIQSAFTQPSSTSSGVGLGNNAPLVQISSPKDTGVGGVQTSQANGPLNIGQPVQQTQQQPKQMKKGGKVGKVMGEFKSGSLKSSSGQKVTNRRQAMAIAMSEAGKAKMKKYAAGGAVKKTRGDGCAQRGKTKGTMR